MCYYTIAQNYPILVKMLIIFSELKTNLDSLKSLNFDYTNSHIGQDSSNKTNYTHMEYILGNEQYFKALYLQSLRK